MMQYSKIYALALGTLFFAACASEQKTKKEQDTTTSGTLHISVDETFKPVMDEEIKVFMSNFPEAKIVVDYKPESEALQDYLSGKVKLVVVSRTLSKEEIEDCHKRNIVPSSLELAKDAIALVLNKDAQDTTFTKSQLRSILAREGNDKHTLVFDHTGSSTLRLIKDSLMQGAPLGKNIYAAKGNYEVIDYVMKNPDAIGFVGLSYISDTMDSTAEKFTTRVKIAAVLNDSTLQYYQPYQADIALKNYPLVRKMTYIKNETYQGLASGFSNFLAYDKGQLIMGKARLVPMRMSIVIRDAAVNTEAQ